MTTAETTRHQTLAYSLMSFILGILILNVNVSSFSAVSISTQALAVTGSVGLLAYIPETLILCISYAVQNYSARQPLSDDCTTPSISGLANGLFIASLLLIPMIGFMFCFPLTTISFVSVDIPLSPITACYFRIFLIGLIFKSLILCLRGFYAAQKSNILFFFVIALTVIANFLLNWYFLHTPSIFHKLDFACIALGYSLAMLLGLLVYIAQLYFDFRNNLIQIPRHLLCRQTISNLLYFMLPLCAHNLLDHFGTMQIFVLTEKSLGVSALASMYLLATVLYLFPGMGFGLTALTFVSKEFGRGNLSHVRSIGNTILFIGVFSMGIVGLILSCFTEQILFWLTPDALLRSFTYTALQMLFFTVPLHVACQITMKCLQAIDQVNTSVYINLSVIYFFRLPAMFYVSFLIAPTILHFQLILLFERLIKLFLFQVFWYRYTQPTVMRFSSNILQQT